MHKLSDFYIEVAKVAYELYEKRGKIHGHDLADWLQAEMIVMKRYEKEEAGQKAQPAAKTNKKITKA